MKRDIVCPYRPGVLVGCLVEREDVGVLPLARLRLLLRDQLPPIHHINQEVSRNGMAGTMPGNNHLSRSFPDALGGMPSPILSTMALCI